MRTTIDVDDLTDEQFAVADRIELALEASPDGLTPSAAAKAARTDYPTARLVLNYLVRNHYAHTSGNGAWTRWHSGRP